MPGLKVVALISGGKDSLFSILHCIANGHEVVALANLHPAPNSGGVPEEDTDSFMYQTIGHAIIPLYEEALGLPLYRQEIAGSAVNQNRHYGHVENAEDGDLDETESLVPLLVKVKQAHPDLNAVSTGAILSDYQRTRVESVALRLGLTPLAYLWQWPTLPPHTESSLLEDMAAVGQDARIVKVASGALDESMLWQNVADARTISRLAKATARFGSVGDGALLGEGGEYETLAMQGPAPLWKATIEVNDESRLLVPGEAGSFSLRLMRPTLVTNPSAAGMDNLRIPQLLDDFAQRTLKRMMDHRSTETSNPTVPLELQPQHGVTMADGGVSYICRTGLGPDAASQMRSIMDEIATDLTSADLQMSDAVYASILLRDIADFAYVNKVYGSYFVEPNPPARITLACADVLPDGASVMVGMTCLPRGTTQPRKGLHVQSRSYWAPANIGPYSQAIAVPIPCSSDNASSDLVYVAGQIPLDPGSMELSCGESNDTTSQSAHQTILALQHMLRIGKRMNIRAWVAAIAFVTKPRDAVVPSVSQMCRGAWRALHERQPEVEDGLDEDEDFDVWDLTQRHGQHIAVSSNRSGLDLTTMQTDEEDAAPPLWVVEVDALPRGATVEWVGYGITSRMRPPPDIDHLQYLLRTFQHRIV